MEDVTDLVQLYRFALRDLWNLYVWRDEQDRADGKIISTFNTNLKSPLFFVLVADKLGHTPQPPSFYFGDCFTVVAANPQLSWTVTMLDRGDAHVVDGASTRLVLIDFFDYGQYGYWDLPYYEVRIDACPEKPELIGRRAIVQVMLAKVMWNEIRKSASINSERSVFSVS